MTPCDVLASFHFRNKSQLRFFFPCGFVEWHQSTFISSGRINEQPFGARLRGKPQIRYRGLKTPLKFSYCLSQPAAKK